LKGNDFYVRLGTQIIKKKMNILSIEIKAKVADLTRIEALLQSKDARFVGEDHQIDTYYKVDEGRLKLRQGNIENSLIRYHRPESLELKRSSVLLQKLPADNEALRQILLETLGLFKVVDKKRNIYFIANVKFHLDEVLGLGTFVEIEALDLEQDKTEQELATQCDYYIDFLGLDRASFVDKSYSDLI
jgi:adenylate cyclase class 2